MDRVCSFSETPPEIPEGPWRRLASFYHSPADVDLFTAGLLETPHEGGLVGRTFNCIIAKQFQALKFGDRFFYTLQDEGNSRNRKSRGPLRFTPAQLDNIMRRSLGDIVCDNTALREVPVDAFIARSKFKTCNSNNVNQLDIPLLLSKVRKG